MEDNPHNRAIINEYRRLDAQAKRTYSENYKNSLENYLNKLNPDNKNDRYLEYAQKNTREKTEEKTSQEKMKRVCYTSQKKQ